MSTPEKRETALLLRRTLEVAHQYAQGGKIYQAADRYLRLAQEYPQTWEGQEAIRRLMEIARQHETRGRRHMALSLYSKVAALAGGSQSRDEEPRFQEEPPAAPAGGETKRAKPIVLFIDLTDKVDLTYNFERLGAVKRTRADIHHTVDSLRKLQEPPHNL